MKKGTWVAVLILIGLAALVLVLYFSIRAAYPRPYSEVVEQSGLPPALVYSVMKAESGFREEAVSPKGAIGIMQLKPDTAEFICKKENMEFDAAGLKDGVYNTLLGCKYLVYLMERFPVRETALAAYNAGEGTVSGWLKNPEYSHDRKTLDGIPYAETRGYVKKIEKFMKIYNFFYG